MDQLKNYVAINKALWNERAKHHMNTAFYDVPEFLKGQNSLNEIELDLLGDVKGKSILHLQCHFGQDSLSLTRMGAKVTGVDFSEEAIKTANELNEKLNLNAEFICCDIYDLPKYLDKEFDIVFTSYGTIGWLPDINKWAQIVSRSLKPKGSFVFAEFHPVVWMFDNDFNFIQYSYFNKEAIVETSEHTYADKNANISLTSIGWNHSMAEVLENLLQEGLELKQFKEFDYSPYNVFPDMVEIEKGKYQISKMEGKIPLVYALKMDKW